MSHSFEINKPLSKNDLRQTSKSSYDSYYWEYPDDEKSYNDNLQKFKNNYLSSYKTNPIHYNINNFGFRTDDDFHYTDTSNIFLGCSHTYGTGHHLKNTWGYLVNEKLNNGKFYNLGHAGSGSTTHLRHFLGWYDYPKKVNAVFHYIPPHIQSNRYEIFKNGFPVVFGYNGSEEGKKLHGQSYEESYAWERQGNFNFLKDVSTLKHYCQKNDIPYILCDIELFRPNGQKEGHRWARDCQHFSLEDHILISEFMIEKYKRIFG